jgi:mannan endo-1,4-beta-mannosidase
LGRVFLVLLLSGCAVPPRPPRVVLIEPRAGLRVATDPLSLAGVVEGPPVAAVRCWLDDARDRVAELPVGPFGEFHGLLHAASGLHQIGCEAADGPPAIASFEVDGFVRVLDGGFAIDGRPFRFVGVNAYYLHEEATRELRGVPSAQGRLDEVLARARAVGSTVVRTWAFNDAPGHDTVLQRAPLRYDADALEGLDRVIAAAGGHDLRLVLVLGNYWPDYGGVPQYLEWHGLPPTEPHRFFTDPAVRAHFREHVARLVGRHNSITGLAYRDDPTILAWELLNEPRGAGLDADGATLASWVAEMAAAVRAVDPNHLVGTGEEGFDGTGHLDATAWRRLGARDAVAEESGTDWVADSSAVDYASIHVYPDMWGVAPRHVAAAGARWIREHAALARAMERPLVVGEFGLPSRELAPGTGHSESARRSAIDLWLGTAAAEPGVAGALGWMLVHDGRPDALDPYAWTWSSGEALELPHARFAELYRQYAALYGGRSD